MRLKPPKSYEPCETSTEPWSVGGTTVQLTVLTGERALLEATEAKTAVSGRVTSQDSQLWVRPPLPLPNLKPDCPLSPAFPTSGQIPRPSW